MARPNKFDGMMHHYCVGLGFCGSVEDGKPLHVTDFIPETGQVSADEFVQWILISEGLKDNDDTWGLREVFVKHMGAEFVDASELRSDYEGACQKHHGCSWPIVLQNFSLRLSAKRDSVVCIEQQRRCAMMGRLERVLRNKPSVADEARGAVPVLENCGKNG